VERALGRRHVGFAPRGNTAFERAMRETQALADQLNQETSNVK
jgi:hypothetical protein